METCFSQSGQNHAVSGSNFDNETEKSEEMGETCFPRQKKGKG